MNSTRLEDHAEISIIENPEKPINKLKLPKKAAHNTPRVKQQQKTPHSKASNFKMADIEPSPSVLTKKKPSPKSVKEKIDQAAKDDSSITTPRSRPKRNVRRQNIFDSDDKTNDKENDYATDWTGDTSYSNSDMLTEDESDDEYEIPKLKNVHGRHTAGTSISKKQSSKKNDKNDLIFLDLSSEEVVRVDANFHANVSEDDLANITRKFLETDLNNEE